MAHDGRIDEGDENMMMDDDNDNDDGAFGGFDDGPDDDYDDEVTFGNRGAASAAPTTASSSGQQKINTLQLAVAAAKAAAVDVWAPLDPHDVPTTAGAKNSLRRIKTCVLPCTATPR